MNNIQIIGRSSSHFTRVALIFAHELELPIELRPVFDLTTLDASAYDNNPALKIPTLRIGDTQVFGAENICRTLAETANKKLRIVWPEQLRNPISRNAQEMIWHAMAAQVQWILGIAFGRLPADNVYFAKGRQGFEGALRWLDDHLTEVLNSLPHERDLSLLEVTLFCLVDHMNYRKTLPLDPYPSLVRYASEFATRQSAQDTKYRSDKAPLG